MLLSLLLYFIFLTACDSKYYKFSNQSEISLIAVAAMQTAITVFFNYKINNPSEIAVV